MHCGNVDKIFLSQTTTDVLPRCMSVTSTLTVEMEMRDVQ